MATMRAQYGGRWGRHRRRCWRSDARRRLLVVKDKLAVVLLHVVLVVVVLCRLEHCIKTPASGLNAPGRCPLEGPRLFDGLLHRTCCAARRHAGRSAPKVFFCFLLEVAAVALSPAAYPNSFVYLLMSGLSMLSSRISSGRRLIHRPLQ